MWTIIQLEDIKVLNNVTKFYKILIKTIPLREQTSLGVTYRQTYRCADGRTGVTLNAPAIVMVTLNALAIVMAGA